MVLTRSYVGYLYGKLEREVRKGCDFITEVGSRRYRYGGPSFWLILPDHAAKAIEPAWFEEGEQIRVADALVVDIRLNAKS